MGFEENVMKSHKRKDCALQAEGHRFEPCSSHINIKVRLRRTFIF